MTVGKSAEHWNTLQRARARDRLYRRDYYLLGLRASGMTYDEMGDAIGVTKQRIEAMLANANRRHVWGLKSFDPENCQRALASGGIDAPPEV